MKFYVILFLIIVPFAPFFHNIVSLYSTENLERLFTDNQSEKLTGPQIYVPSFSAYNTKEQMTLSPIFTPDNALDLYVFWINKANSSLKIQNPYFRTFDTGSWSTDSSPIVKAIVNAKSRGVAIQIQINLDVDTDNVASYFNGLGIPVRGMGSSASSPDQNYLSTTHNKLVIIDSTVVLLSSINFSEQAFSQNREAGMIIQNSNVTTFFTQVFDADWTDGEIPPLLARYNNDKAWKPGITDQGIISHTNIPQANFTGIYNVTVFTNPDNADEVIFRHLESATQSIYVSMYTISRPAFTDTLINLKKANPSLDIQVLISNRRFGSSENIDTQVAAETLVNNLIPVFNSTQDNDKVNGFYHNKYWIIDGTDVFVYSGNWSPKSVAPSLVAGDASYASGEANRDMGIAVHNAPEIANFFTNEVWKKDVAVADAWPLPAGVQFHGIADGDVLQGNVLIQGVLSDIQALAIYTRWDDQVFTKIQSFNSLSTSFEIELNTSQVVNGVHTFEVKVVTNSSQEFLNSFNVTVANYYAPSNNWRVLVTEVLADPSTVVDSQGEFYEITNSFPFSVLLGGWTTGDDKNTMVFPTGYIIQAYSSIIVARNQVGFESAFSVPADFELGMSLTNTADYVFLMNSRQEYIDVVAYGMSAPDNSEELSPAGSGKSLQRVNLYYDSNAASDFKIDIPTPKSPVSHTPLETETSTIFDTIQSDGKTTTFSNFAFILSLIAVVFSKLSFRSRRN